MTGCSRSLLAIALAALAVSHVVAQVKPNEYQVKAAYLYNFGKFVTWPASSPSDPFTLCVLGRDPFGADLDNVIAHAKIGERSVVARRLAKVSEASGCQIVFISSSEADRLDGILPTLNKMGTLTVSDLPKFAQRNGMIQFVMDSGRVRFEVNQKAAEDAGLSLSSQLLKVASSVKRGGAGDD